MLFRDGTGRRLNAPDGVLLGATPGAVYAQAEETLEVGDLLVLHTDGLVPGHSAADSVNLLLDLGPRLGEADTAQDFVRLVVDEFGESEREGDACVLVARVTY